MEHSLDFHNRAKPFMNPAKICVAPKARLKKVHKNNSMGYTYDQNP